MASMSRSVKIGSSGGTSANPRARQNRRASSASIPVISRHLGLGVAGSAGDEQPVGDQQVEHVVGLGSGDLLLGRPVRAARPAPARGRRRPRRRRARGQRAPSGRVRSRGRSSAARRGVRRRVEPVELRLGRPRSSGRGWPPRVTWCPRGRSATCSPMGISTPWAAASSRRGRADFTPSATMRMSARISSRDGPGRAAPPPCGSGSACWCTWPPGRPPPPAPRW